MIQLPFWMAPINDSKREACEEISIPQQKFGIGIGYQLCPPNSIVDILDEVSVNNLNPVSGVSRYIGKTKRLVDGDALSFRLCQT